MKKPVVLALSIAGILAPAAWLVAIGIERDKPLGTLLWMGAAGVLSGFGLVAIVSLVTLFAVRSLGKPPATIAIVAGEEVLGELRANHFMGIEGRGGTLVVTSRRLLFHPHRYNVQLAPIAIELSRIDGVVPWMTTLRIDAAGRKQRFVVHEPNRVAELVRELVRAPEEDRSVLAPSFSSLTGAKRRARALTQQS